MIYHLIHKKYVRLNGIKFNLIKKIDLMYFSLIKLSIIRANEYYSFETSYLRIGFVMRLFKGGT